MMKHIKYFIVFFVFFIGLNVVNAEPEFICNVNYYDNEYKRNVTFKLYSVDGNNVKCAVYEEDEPEYESTLYYCFSDDLKLSDLEGGKCDNLDVSFNGNYGDAGISFDIIKTESEDPEPEPSENSFICKFRVSDGDNQFNVQMSKTPNDIYVCSAYESNNRNIKTEFECNGFTSFDSYKSGDNCLNAPYTVTNKADGTILFTLGSGTKTTQAPTKFAESNDFMCSKTGKVNGINVQFNVFLDKSGNVICNTTEVGSTINPAPITAHLKCDSITAQDLKNNNCSNLVLNVDSNGDTATLSFKSVEPSPDIGSGTGGDKINNSSLEYVSCGDLEQIPKPVPVMTSFAYKALKILTPVVLIFMGMVDLMKSIMAGKQDEISKAQSSLIKKLLIAALVFLLASIIQFVVKVTAKSSDSGSVITCMECFLNNNCS